MMLNKRFFIMSVFIILSFYSVFAYYDYQYSCLEVQLRETKATMQSDAEKHNAEYNALCDDNATLQGELDITKQTISDLTNEEYEFIYLGDFKITHYCDESYEHICGYGNHMTASGKPTEIGVTAAADWSVLPKGSVVYIAGVGFREITDVGGAVNGKHIDVLVDTHETAMDLGVKTKDVWLLIKKS